MYYVYVIRSKCGRFYTGSTDDIENRVRQHNDKIYRSWTNRYDEWQLVYSESFSTRKEALVRERQIKGMKGGIMFQRLISDS